MQNLVRRARAACTVLACAIFLTNGDATLTIPATGAIAAGENYTVALKSDGTVWTWGGQLRSPPAQVSGLTSVAAIKASYYSYILALKTDGTVWTYRYDWNSESFILAQVTGLSSVVAVAASGYHGAALKSDGTVWTWGFNSFGELGNGTIDWENETLTPVQVSSLTSITAIAAGGNHTLALKSDGTVWTWGDNSEGQLGDNTRTNRSAPVQVSSLSSVTAVAAGNNHSIALKSDGTLWAWGHNAWGEVGDGTNTRRKTPVQVSGLTSVTAVESSGGQSTIALKSDGSVWVWGNDLTGVVPDGTYQSHNIPTQVNGLTSVVAVSIGDSHATALKSDGTIVTWGASGSGQVGDGSNHTTYSSPTQVKGLTSVTNLAAWEDVTLALKSDGTVWSWGAGALGTGSVRQNTPLKVTGLTGVTAVSTSGRHALALKSDGTVRSWGYNHDGQLGDGTTIERSSPVQVSGLTGVVAIATGDYHSAALKSDGTVWFWGVINGADSEVPLQVSGLTGVVKLVSGPFHITALKSAGTVWSWGNNYFGLFGDGTTDDSEAPVQATMLSNVVSIAIGSWHALYLKNDGTVWAWGDNYMQQLGFAAYFVDDPYLTPIQVSGLTGVTAIGAGYFHSLAVKTDGTVWGWGLNDSGQLGYSPTDSETGTSTSPTQFAGVTGATKVVGGYRHTVILKNDGTVWACGDNSSGQLGVFGAPVFGQAAIRLITSSGDTNQNGISDTWETQYFGNLTHTGTADTDGDGLNDLEEFIAGSDPTSTNTDGDEFPDAADLYPNDYFNNETPTLSILGGDNQTAAPGAFNAAVFDVGVWNAAATSPLVDAPVTFTVTSGGGKVAETTSSSLLNSLTLFSDIDGTVQALFFKQPSTSATASVVTVTAGAAQVVFHTNSTTADTDSDGLSDAWELLYFGNLTHGAAEDIDTDGLSNLQEFQAGTNPTSADTDTDGMKDGRELLFGRNPLKGVVPDTTHAVDLKIFQPTR